MRPKRLYGVGELGPSDLRSGRVEPHYEKVLVRLLSAHAMAEKLTALGYQRALGTVADPSLHPVIKKNFAEERRHARLVYRALEEIGVSESAADRAMVRLLKSPSFEAPRYFAERAEGETDLLMASLALDATGLLMIGINYKESSYAPHARAAEIILEEEAEHDEFATELLGRAVESLGRDKVAEALRQWLPRAVNFFGPPGTGFTYDCLRYGLKSRDNQELAELFLTMLERRAGQLGVELPALTSGYPHAAA
jgi:1,2-phenylacetyl-CoA epoxidase catalytic subunit